RTRFPRSSPADDLTTYVSELTWTQESNIERAIAGNMEGNLTTKAGKNKPRDCGVKRGRINHRGTKTQTFVSLCLRGLFPFQSSPPLNLRPSSLPCQTPQPAHTSPRRV